jgi:predicted branched-subunit amino acid permease
MVDELQSGARKAVPLALSVAAYGVTFGLTSTQLPPEGTFAMSLFVFAGSSQIAALRMWNAPAVQILLAVLIINLRHLAMGPGLTRQFSSIGSRLSYGSAFFLGDETWMLTVQEDRQRDVGVWFLIGAGIVVYCGWVGSTASGLLLRTLIDPQIMNTLQLALPAAIVAILVGSVRGQTGFAASFLAFTVGVLCHRPSFDGWDILLGAVVGGVVGGLLEPKQS